jgi:hypothetical protein
MTENELWAFDLVGFDTSLMIRGVSMASKNDVLSVPAGRRVEE